MDQEKSIKAAAAYAGMPISGVAKAYGASPQAFGQKLKRGGFNDTELSRIAEIIGAKYEAHFVFEDGAKI